MSMKHFQIQYPVFDAFENQHNTSPNTAKQNKALP